jgi:hypothetical protein
MPQKKTTTKAPKAMAPRKPGKHKRLPKPGGTISRTYKGAEYTLKVVKEGFELDGKTYTSLTAAAKAVKGPGEVNGWQWWGLLKED